MRVKLLIADDEAVLVDTIKEYMEYEEFEGEPFDIEVARNGAVALKMLQNNYDIVILDLKMPEVDGTQIIEANNLIESQKRPWIILITAYPVTYEMSSIMIRMGVREIFPKPFELPDLMEKIKDYAKSRRQLLEAERHHVKLHCNWTLALSESGTSFISVNGVLNLADSCPLPWTRSDSLVAGHGADFISALYSTSGELSGYAKPQAKIVGTNLFGKLFVENIQQSFVAAGSVVSYRHNLKLTFIGPRHSLQLPFEFLHDGTDFFVLRHPMKRMITRVHSKLNTSLSDLLHELQSRREKLRILLIASNTYSHRIPRIDGVDEEVTAVYKQISKSLGTDHLAIDYLPTERATYEEVMAHLEERNYHIIHYAGHGRHDKVSPEKSSLFFWEKRNCQGNVKALTVNRLKNTLCLKGYDLRFIYLSCCQGATTSDEHALLSDNFLGMADGLIQAGVPSVLGFRWPISDRGAKELASAFYQSLLSQGHLDTALFHARCKVEGDEEDEDIGDWLSPVLIVQG